MHHETGVQPVGAADRAQGTGWLKRNATLTEDIMGKTRQVTGRVFFLLLLIDMDSQQCLGFVCLRLIAF